jgi:hypothetical protein
LLVDSRAISSRSCLSWLSTNAVSRSPWAISSFDGIKHAWSLDLDHVGQAP